MSNIADPERQFLTYRFRLLPTSAQHKRLSDTLNHTRDLYNAALEERINAYKKTKRFITLNDQQKGLTELRSDPMWANLAVSLQRWPLKKVDLAFRAFFRRLRSGKGKAGFPRFKGGGNFKAFGYTDQWGWCVERERLVMKGIGAIRLHIHRVIPGKPVAVTVKREGAHWFALLTFSVQTKSEHHGPPIGLDFGVAQLVTTSAGEHIQNDRHAARQTAKVRRAQRAIQRCKRQSANRRKAVARLAIIKCKEANSRSTRLHQISADLSARFSLIAVEALPVTQMTSSARGTVEKPGRNISQKAGMNRSVRDASFGRLKEMLRYKAARAGGKLIEVDARYSSQTCAVCGQIDKASRKSQARFICTACGHRANADVNAAQIIALRGGVAIPGALNLRAYPE